MEGFHLRKFEKKMTVFTLLAPCRHGPSKLSELAWIFDPLGWFSPIVLWKNLSYNICEYAIFTGMTHPRQT
ncbi:hypothetical protein PR048_029148 [Dryococelus australis]|uniref:Uncharacterized protein n=1 Tax=Dryococelus australis TaxID=614101 RepID=A0ABQ9GFY0_9NEOP|nr:hypothetical protein PR048_029148 [Dryococelus australis]